MMFSFGRVIAPGPLVGAPGAIVCQIYLNVAPQAAPLRRRRASSRSMARPLALAICSQVRSRPLRRRYW